MPIYRLDGIAPDIHPDTWIAPTAVLIGRVRLRAGASVWYGAVLRGDNEWIEVGAGSNVQDNAVCHTSMGAPLTIGAGVTVGHKVMLHGCTIGDGALIGMNAVVLDHAVVGEAALVGAQALVAEGKTIPPRTLALGAPARPVRPLTQADLAGLERAATGYVANWRHFEQGCEEV
ncbi:gamma-class carbonic anhydrase family protein [Stappia sp. 22II-S9-Z10]|nr:gamma-class carbonic anhydrase family protein [Stappia sp. 22II-S9-Z10]